MKQYTVHGGGWYIYLFNDKTKVGRWAMYTNKKKGERELFNEEEADKIIARNASSYMKMANVFKEEVVFREVEK